MQGDPPSLRLTPYSGSGKTQVTLQMAFKGPATASLPLTSTQRAMRLLTNTANACFINSVLQALFQVRRPDFDFRLCAVLEEMRTTSNGRPLNPSFALRSLARGWRLMAGSMTQQSSSLQSLRAQDPCNLHRGRLELMEL